MFKKLLAFLTRDGQPAPSEFECEPEHTPPKPPQQADTQQRQQEQQGHAQQANKTPQGKKSAFSGEHFEGLGDVWEALLGLDENFIEIAVKFASDWNFPNRSHHTDEEGNLILLTRSPAEGPLAAGVLNTRAAGSDEIKVRSCYPLLQGYPNPLTILETHTWANGLEGAVAAYKYPDGPPLDFFAPFYFLDQKTFALAMQEKKALVTELGAVAFSLRAAEIKEYAVDEGALYEAMLKSFLDENPNNTQADFQDPIISTQGMRLLMPTQYTCEWAYRCPVEAMEELTFDGKSFLKLTVPLIGANETEIRAYLYASEAELNGYRPSVGEDIEGVLWMSGSIAYEIGDAMKDGVSEE